MQDKRGLPEARVLVDILLHQPEPEEKIQF
jgi:hypothetical protein